MFNNFLPRIVPDRTQMAIRHMRSTCLISKATDTHTQNMKYLLLFYNSNHYANAPQYYIARTLLILFVFCSPLRGSSAGT